MDEKVLYIILPLALLLQVGCYANKYLEGKGRDENKSAVLGADDLKSFIGEEVTLFYYEDVGGFLESNEIRGKVKSVSSEHVVIEEVIEKHLIGVRGTTPGVRDVHVDKNRIYKIITTSTSSKKLIEPRGMWGRIKLAGLIWIILAVTVTRW